jgi:hypothetical protein
MMEEPDILSGTEPLTNDNDIEAAKVDLDTLSEDEFQTRYKSSKSLYRALIIGIEVLKEVQQALTEPTPLEIDSEIIDATYMLMEDFGNLMEQMHMASYWEREGM